MKLARALLLFAPLVCACRQDMHDAPRYDTYEPSSFFSDKRSARPHVEGTIARGQLELDPHLYQGKTDGKPAETFPFDVTRAVLERGRERYDIYCAPCHSQVGDGYGMIVQRGMRQPPSFHVERLQKAPPGYYFDVITNGFGAMYDYSDRIEAKDRWAIVAYIRALQKSRNATLADVPETEREKLAKNP